MDGGGESGRKSILKRLVVIGLGAGMTLHRTQAATYHGRMGKGGRMDIHKDFGWSAELNR